MSSNYGKRVLLVLTDGKDNNSKHTFYELERLLGSSGVVFYAVGAFDADQDVAKTLGMEERGILDELSSVTGGRSYYPKKEGGIDKAFRDVATELRNQYSLTLELDPNRSPHTKHHTLKVKLAMLPNSTQDLRNAKVRSRQGYYTQ